MSAEFTHKQSLVRMRDIQDELERLSNKAATNGELSREDETYWHELEAEFDSLDQHRRNLEREATRARVTAVMEAERPTNKVEAGTPRAAEYDADPILNPDSVEDCRFRNPWDLSEVRTFSRSKGEIGQELRSRALSAVEKMSAASDNVRNAATHILEHFDDGDSRIARMCLATSSPEYLRAWSKLATGREHMLSTEERDAVTRAMSLTDNQGGYLVPFQLDPTVILTSDGSLNEIRKVARTVVATGDVWHGVSAGEVSWSWDGEAVEVSDDSPTFAQPTVTVHKAAGFVPISIEALADEANVTAEVGKLLAAGKDTLEAQAFISGNGSGQPVGILHDLVTNHSATCQVKVNTTAAFDDLDVYKLDSDLPARYRGGASFLANRSIYNVVRSFGGGGGSDMWERIGADMPPQLLGRPAYEAEAMPSTHTGTDNFLIFGDFENYVIADRIGMTVELVQHLFGSNRRPTGQRGWYAYYRVGADVVNPGGFRYLNGTQA